MSTSIILEGGYVLLAKDELLDTIVIDASGQEYVRTCDGVWQVHKEIQVPVKAVNKQVYKHHAICVAGIKKKRKSRPPTAYNVFLKRVMKELAASHPEMLCTERMQYAATMWRKE